MATRHIIVDGYNVIRADPTLQRAERVSLEEARRVLLSTLNSSPRLRNDEVTVVFDGTFEGRPYANSQRFGRVTALYSARGQTADDVIKARVGVLSGSSARPADIVVVTNDGEIRRHCLALGCQVSGSENLLNQLPGPRHAQLRRQALQRQERDDEVYGPPPGGPKKGNPRRKPKRERRPQDYRF